MFGIIRTEVVTVDLYNYRIHFAWETPRGRRLYSVGLPELCKAYNVGDIGEFDFHAKGVTLLGLSLDQESPCISN